MKIIWESEPTRVGGSISFSTKVNAVTVSRCNVINLFISAYLSRLNKVKLKRRLRSICYNHGVKGWSLTARQGQYFSPDGICYNESSYLLEIIGTSLETLMFVGIEICDTFSQRSVLICDYNRMNYLRVTK